MDANKSVSSSTLAKNFALKKWILMVCCTCYILILIYLMITSKQIVDEDMKYYGQYTSQEEYREQWKKYFIYNIALLSITTVIECFGLLASYYENYGLMVFFTIFHCIDTICQLIQAFNLGHWLPAICSLTITIIAVDLLKELHISRRP